MTVSDPAGRAVFEIDRSALATYQFATRTGVMLEDNGKIWSVLNVRGLAIPEFKDRVAEPVVYDGETPEARIARRKAKWTPTEIVWR